MFSRYGDATGLTDEDVLRTSLKISQENIEKLKERISRQDDEIARLKGAQCTSSTDMNSTIVTYQNGITFTIHPCDNGCRECKNTACIDPPRMEKFLEDRR